MSQHDAECSRVFPTYHAGSPCSCGLDAQDAEIAALRARLAEVGRERDRKRVCPQCGETTLEVPNDAEAKLAAAEDTIRRALNENGEQRQIILEEYK